MPACKDRPAERLSRPDPRAVAEQPSGGVPVGAALPERGQGWAAGAQPPSPFPPTTDSPGRLPESGRGGFHALDELVFMEVVEDEERHAHHQQHQEQSGGLRTAHEAVDKNG
jgi:hypothetical protein